MWFKRFLLSLGVLKLNMVKLPRREEGAEFGFERGGDRLLFVGVDSLTGEASEEDVRRFN